MTTNSLGRLVASNYPLVYDSIKRWGDANCYEYAHGINMGSYSRLGELSYMRCDETRLTLAQVIHMYYTDMQKRGVQITPSTLQEVIKSGEFKIAIFYRPYNRTKHHCADYHFMRQDSDLLWSHKQGKYFPPSRLDDKGKMITNPKEAIIKDYTFVDFYKGRVLED